MAGSKCPRKENDTLVRARRCDRRRAIDRRYVPRHTLQRLLAVKDSYTSAFLLISAYEESDCRHQRPDVVDRRPYSSVAHGSAATTHRNRTPHNAAKADLQRCRPRIGGPYSR